MEKSRKAMLCAAGFFGLNLGSQNVITYVYAVILGVRYGFSAGFSGSMPDYSILYQTLKGELLGKRNDISLFSGLLLLVVLVLLFSIRRKNVFREVGFHRMSFLSVLPLLLLGGCANILLVFLLNMLPTRVLEAYSQASNMLTAGNNTTIYLLSTVFMAPLVEEIVFRGLMFSRLRRGIPMLWAAAIVTVLFGVLHGQILWICYATLLGILLVYTVWKFNSIWASLAIHIAFNGMNFLLNSLKLSGTASLVLLLASAAGFLASFLWLMLLPNPPKPIKQPMPRTVCVPSDIPPETEAPAETDET